jgi:deoxyadenosine/deoxycytidine kinase
MHNSIIVEFVGPAGSGKSTLSKALLERLRDAKILTRPTYKKVENIPFFVRNLLCSLPLIFQIYLRSDRRYSLWYHLTAIVTINGWDRLIKESAAKDKALFLIDQGPVYMITFETLFGSRRVESDIMRDYWERIFKNWAETIDYIIWLDTSLPELTERIRKRETVHGVKALNDSEAYKYLESYRQTYEAVVLKMMACSRELKVLRIDTGKVSIEDAIEKIVNELCVGN